MVGSGWSIAFLVFAGLCLIATVGRILYEKSHYSGFKEIPKGWLITTAILTVILFYLGMFSVNHVKIPINNRAIMITNVEQNVVDVIGPGTHRKKNILSYPMLWPSNTQGSISTTMQRGVESATTKDQTAVIVSLTLYLDLSEMDIEKTFRAVNGNFTVYFDNNLRKAIFDTARIITEGYTASELTSLRDKWEKEFDTLFVEYLKTEDFNVKLVSGRTKQSWDFDNPAVAAAYDAANLAIYTQKQRENEKAALTVEQDMAVMRGQMLSSTTGGTISSLEQIAIFFDKQQPETRPYLSQYLNTLVNLEYLRLVGEQKPVQFLPPNSDTVPVYTTNQVTEVVPPNYYCNRIKQSTAGLALKSKSPAVIFFIN